MAFDTKTFAVHFRRAGPPALLAAALAAGPAFAQSVTVETGSPAVETEKKTTVKEKWNGDTVVKEKTTTKSSDDATISTERRVVDEPATTTTTTTVR